MKPVALIILDGWGWREARNANAVRLAKTPNFDRFWNSSPHTFLNTTGLAVGLPDGVMGNSEVGHMNIGAGRVVYQDLTRINESMRSGEFASNAMLQKTFAQVKSSNATLHLMGLVSDGGVHSHIDHLCALLDAAKDADVLRVAIHAFTDGRDTSPTSGEQYLARVQQQCDTVGNAVIATVCGRYYAMDRDRRWERTHLAYAALVAGEGDHVSDAVAAVCDAYARDVTDEFMKPMVVDGTPRIAAGDTVLFFNYRGDRTRQLCRALGEETFAEFDRDNAPALHQLVCMTRYHQDFDYPVLYAKQHLTNILGDVVAAHGKRQLRIAETEKYAHVTFFLNGGRDGVVKGEEHALIQSPKDVATYDEKPEMSAGEVTQTALSYIARRNHDLIILNYANPDMVGHTGVIDAAVKAVETVDTGMGQLVDAIVAQGGAVIVTADHGNCEEMRTPEGMPHTAHTTNPVPCFLAGYRKHVTLRDGGKLADLAPTLLALMGLPQPSEMTGESLFTQ